MKLFIYASNTENLYRYTGPLYEFGYLIKRDYSCQTWAPTIKRAKSNIEHKLAIDKHNGVHGKYRISGNSKFYEVIDVSPDQYENTSSINYCNNCGARLTDGGDCPVCDYGEENL